MGVLKKDVFGQYLFIKKGIIRTMGVLIYPRFNWINKTKISGAEILRELPNENVLFVSNHQTYFADVGLFLQVFHASLAGKPNTIKYPGFLFSKKNNIIHYLNRLIVSNIHTKNLYQKNRSLRTLFNIKK